jgi:hypothetical protein
MSNNIKLDFLHFFVRCLDHRAHHSLFKSHVVFLSSTSDMSNPLVDFLRANSSNFLGGGLSGSSNFGGRFDSSRRSRSGFSGRFTGRFSSSRTSNTRHCFLLTTRKKFLKYFFLKILFFITFYTFDFLKFIYQQEILKMIGFLFFQSPTHPFSVLLLS